MSIGNKYFFKKNLFGGDGSDDLYGKKDNSNKLI